METFSALLAICAGNSPVPGEFPAQRPVTWSFDVFFDLCPNKRLSKQCWGWWFETPSCSLWRHCNEQWALLTCDSVSFVTVCHRFIYPLPWWLPSKSDIKMAERKTAVTPMLTYRSYYSLALSHRYMSKYIIWIRKQRPDLHGTKQSPTKHVHILWSVLCSMGALWGRNGGNISLLA